MPLLEIQLPTGRCSNTVMQMSEFRFVLINKFATKANLYADTVSGPQRGEDKYTLKSLYQGTLRDKTPVILHRLPSVLLYKTHFQKDLNTVTVQCQIEYYLVLSQ